MFRSLMAALLLALCATTASADCTRCQRLPVVRTVIGETVELGVDAARVVGKTLHGTACLVRKHVVAPTVALGRAVHNRVEDFADQRSCLKCERLQCRAERAVARLNDCGCVPQDYTVEEAGPTEEAPKPFSGEVVNSSVSATK